MADWLIDFQKTYSSSLLSSTATRRPTMAAGVPGVLGAPAPGPAAVESSLPSAFATTHHHATMVVTAQARGPFTAPAMSRRAHHQVSADRSLCQPPSPPPSPLKSSIIHPFLFPPPQVRVTARSSASCATAPRQIPKG